MLNVEPSVFGIPRNPQVPIIRHKSSRSSMVGSLKSFLTPKKKSNQSSHNGSAIPSPVSRRVMTDSMSSSPFKSHYEHTFSVDLDAVSSVPIVTGPWSPARVSPNLAQQLKLNSTQNERQTSSISTIEDGRKVETREEERTKTVTLSMVLDNCVILEEYLKEVVSVITARRALGIDQVGFI